MQINSTQKGIKRNIQYKKEVLINRHYWISDTIQIGLIKIATKERITLSEVVRKALTAYIEKQLKKKKYGL